MPVEIIEIRNVYDENGDLMARHVELELSGPQGAYLWRHGNVPLGFTREQARQYIADNFDAMYAQAVERGEQAPGGVLDNPHIDQLRLLKAVALVNLDAVNALRVRANMPELTVGQLVSAVKAKYTELGE